MVTVVAQFQFLVHLLVVGVVYLGQPLYILTQRGGQLFFCDAAQCRKSRIHRHVGQVVDGGEDAELGELGDACDKAELDHWLQLLQTLIEFLHHLAYLLQPAVLMKHVEQWRVVLVDDDRHLLVGRCIGTLYQTGETHARRRLPYTPAIERLIRGQHVLQLDDNVGGAHVLGAAQVQVDDGIGLPLLLQLHDLQTGKQLAVAAEIRLQRRREQRLAETARTAHEYVCSVMS